MEIRIERYTTALTSGWNNFIKGAKNGLFLFDRSYMDYHADRYTDHSLLFYKGNELMCVLPANESGNTLYSHQGLTYGGMVISRRASSVFVLEAFKILLEYLQQQNLQSLVYKSIPFIFHQLPAQEDMYGLFRMNAQLYRRDISSVIDLSKEITYTKGTRSNLTKARKNDLRVEESRDFKTFMEIEEVILRVKYNSKPTHTTDEIELLASRFPENITLYLAYKQGQCLGGTILFKSAEVLHTQYIGITDDGKEVGALDFLIDFILQNNKEKYRYFSFGISTEEEGRNLNEGLIQNKESFGARAVCLDFYRIDIL